MVQKASMVTASCSKVVAENRLRRRSLLLVGNSAVKKQPVDVFLLLFLLSASSCTDNNEYRLCFLLKQFNDLSLWCSGGLRWVGSFSIVVTAEVVCQSRYEPVSMLFLLLSIPKRGIDVPAMVAKEQPSLAR